MSDKSGDQSQSFSIGGTSQVVGSQIGSQAAGDSTMTSSGNTISAVQQIGTDGEDKPLTANDVVELLGQLEALIAESGLSDSEKEKLKNHLGVAKEEAQATEPDKGFAAKSLQRATQVLKDAGETVEAGQSLWKNVHPLFSKLSPWLGVALTLL